MLAATLGDDALHEKCILYDVFPAARRAKGCTKVCRQPAEYRRKLQIIVIVQRLVLSPSKFKFAGAFGCIDLASVRRKGVRLGVFVSMSLGAACLGTASWYIVNRFRL